jgi:hypothetical protein
MTALIETKVLYRIEQAPSLGAGIVCLGCNDEEVISQPRRTGQNRLVCD